LDGEREWNKMRARARYLSATHTQHAVCPPLAAAMASQFATMNSSAIIGEGADHTSVPPLQSISISPQRAPHAASTGPVLLQTIAIELFFIPLSGSGQTNTAVEG
jgi:hypothetical protein